MRTRPNGFVVWEGPSLLDGSTPIVVIVTGLGRPSTNRKTGGMVQTYILARDTPPMTAVRSGVDAAICGDCPHRLQADGRRTCYVNLAHGPRSVWEAYQRGAYPRRHPAGVAHGRAVRLGTYGDPAAAPVGLWRALIAGARTWTGYTHQPRGAQHLAGLAMVSVDSPEAASDAAELGLRYFRVGAVGERPAGNETLCPASAEAGHKTTCEACGLCNGTRPGDRRRSIFIPAHGPAKKAVGRLPIV